MPPQLSFSKWQDGRALLVFLLGLFCSLSWLPKTSAEEKSAADYFISSLPGAPDGPLLKMHAGHIEITPEHHGHLFFWHFQNRHIANKQRTVIWLNGGPGCSSMDGAMIELGPYRVREGGKLVYNNGSWDEFANLLFVDNPVGTGFSYVDTDSFLHELQEMADQFIVFLEKWFAIFPEYAQDDIYIAGESYAGQHIPYIARAVVARNKATDKTRWNLKGLLIGNGWIAPKEQYLSYLPFAYKEGILKEGSASAGSAERRQSLCTGVLETSGEHVNVPACERILTDILEATKDHSADSMHECINMYDIRLRDDFTCGMNWPPDLADVTPYLRRDDVKNALHINPDKKTGWQECNGAVGSQFTAANSEPSIQLLPELLSEMQILLFSGDRDMICNHIGTEDLINNMEWNGGKGFEISPGVWAPRRDWTFESEPAGFWQEARNLTYVLFYNASHMVPFDYPRRTRDMLDRFMGVDIASIGGHPADSRLDGEKGPLTSVGGHPNSTEAEAAEKERLKEATWRAYYKSGEVALVVVAIAAALWGWYVWTDRRKRRGYQGVLGADPSETSGGRESFRDGFGLEDFRHKRSGNMRDLEAADFDEAELDRVSREGRRPAEPRYSLGEASSSSESSDGRPDKTNERQ